MLYYYQEYLREMRKKSPYAGGEEATPHPYVKYGRKTLKSNIACKMQLLLFQGTKK